ncbi:MAG: hypothetical protein IT208_17860 [Chthonomonadales bacterium]|nr:hypothetical protein [Chthonomonadales bacterium]
MQRPAASIALALLLLLPGLGATSAAPSDRLERAALEALSGGAEPVRGRAEAWLVWAEGAQPLDATDPRLGARYGAACRVYVAESGLFVRRFTVWAPDAAHLPFARKAGRWLALLWGAAHARFGMSASRLRGAPLDVWLTRSGEAGGEQWRSSIYVYDVMAERTGIEWARTLSHEYGHYLLPSPSGYAEPESWANGLLGERLFLSWMADDLRSGAVSAEEAPYVTLHDLDEYRARQVTPLLDRALASGPDEAALGGTAMSAMDAFTALELYVDAVYGPEAIMDALMYLPAGAADRGLRGPAFAAAFAAWARARPRFVTRLPAGDAVVFLPRGSWKVVSEAPGRRALRVEGAQVRAAGGGWRVVAGETRWRRVRAPGAPGPCTLRWERQ